jgi:SAF domain
VTTTSARVAVDGRGAYLDGRPGTPLPTRHRRPGYIALAVVLIVGLAALGAYWYSRAGQKTPVVVVIRDVPAGHTIARSDVSTVDVAGAVTAIGGSRINSVVGQAATVELLPNTLLQRSMLTSSDPLPATDAMVGVQVRPGQLPANGLSEGATVQVLQLPSKDNVTGAGPPAVLTAIVLATQATVYGSASDPSQTGGTLVTLIAPKTASSAIAAASGAGRVGLVQVGR